MAEGKDKIASSLMDLQPTAILEFFVIYPDPVNHPTVEIRIHAGSIYSDSLTWQGKTYIPVPVEVEGFEQSATGQLARPKIRIANKDYLITSLLQKYDDLQFAKVIRKRTFVKYLDEVNFEGGNPYGDADSTAELSNEEYVIGQKTQESKVLVEFELTSPLDLETFEINNRRIMGKYCGWTYRGCGCNYQGVPLQQENGKPFHDSDGVYVVPNIGDLDSINSDPSFLWEKTKGYSRGDAAYIENENVLINPYKTEGSPEPMKIWYVAVSGSLGSAPDSNPSFWQKDGCNKKLSSCRLRFNDSPQIAYQTGSSYSEGQLLNFSGELNSGMLTSIDENILEIPRNSDFTFAFWYKSVQSNNMSAFFQTSDDEHGGFRAITHNDNMWVAHGPTSSENAHPYMNVNPSIKSDMTLVILEVYRMDSPREPRLWSEEGMKDTSGMMQSFTSQVTKSVHKWYRGWAYLEDAKFPGDDDFGTTFNQITYGINTFRKPDTQHFTWDHSRPTPNFELGACMMWSGILTSPERYELLGNRAVEGDVQTFYPLRYEQATGKASALTGDSNDPTGLKLVYWLEKTGLVGTTTGFLDSSPNGYDFTGFGYGFSNFSYKTMDTTVLTRKESSAMLPFGGFPGTDGFSF